MVRQDVEIGLTAVDEASDVVAAASKRISDSLQQVSDTQRDLSNVVEGSLSPLTESEQAQMNNASAAVQLNSAQVSLREAQKNLNGAIIEYGADSTQAAAALRDLNAAQANVTTLQTQVGETTKQNDVSMRSFTTGISGVATASFSLYGAYDRVNESEISLDRSNLMVKSSTKAVEDAHRAVSEAIAKHGVNSQEATSAEDALSIAEDRLTLANERSQQAQENVNKSIMSAALQIIPTSITMVDSLSRAWKNFPDMTGVLTTLGTNVSMVGNKALVASVSVAAFVGGFTVGYEAITQFGDALGPAGRALMVIVPGIIAAAAAVWALQEGLTLGVATVALVASGIAIGAMVANLQSYGNAIGMATGGVVNKPTFVVVGEAGPEIVMPLSQYEAQRAMSVQTQVAVQSGAPQNVTYITLEQHIHGDIVSPADEDSVAQKAVDRLDEELYRRRNG
jgi:hypothetical protein